MSSTAAKKDVKSSAVPVTAVVEKKEFEEEEFEEFPVQEWAERAEGEEDDVNVWEDNWDDETHESEFSKQLKEELRKSGHQVA
ncbi:putative 26S proteasome complex subunit dss-1 [Caenorhabditis elegans]|uniref:Probable 26S proteasome complex subunit dss-1 n=1 Tax=Caenorhabditis elegans TaxID=6239 RepID=DSS1_CAEEL|nr:putative 26S proteasome complex subunit dss-1 [Caenorhabditis elegans]Q95Y72.2 RecName: Full=Probable 26S proteasome complex subunit dss-1; AltName: Full=Deleted in split hand/split foot protein 1 homolog [Caenorhabditis elegans]CCD73924.1 Probable 26S proteasome complex subunit dss-1 [Caenorhabditis elegans]|eukprot:NP_497346.2 Probable 26S proteasome complex subunit dss-1 [Caenorhabditis elegans]